MWRDRRRYRVNVSKSRKLVKIARLAFLGVIGIFVLLFFLLPLLAFNLPSPDKIVRQEGFATKILDRNGQSLYDIYSDKRRNPVNLVDIPVYLRQGTIAIEDKNFYSHQGFDPIGMLRGFSRIFTRGYAQGGSTLTQQLVKNVLLTSDYSVVRKIKEFVLAIQIERKYSKDEILQMYLNEAPYGGTAYGVESASEIYFGKKVQDLNLVESAILAGMPQRPTAFSPYSSTPKAYVKRAEEVLRRMREDAYITREQEQSAISQLDSVQFQPRGADFKAPHFVQYVQEILEERYGQAAVEQGGLQVITTLDLELQEKAQQIVAEEIEKVVSQHITNGAAVVVNPETGEILSMVGSKDFNAEGVGQYNVVTALRQPGSSFKPFTYVTGFKKGYTPASLLMDVPTVFPGGVSQPDYIPVNYDSKFVGPIQVRYALANSRNIPAVKMLAKVGIKDVLTTATDMGITTLPPTNDTLKRVGLSLTLGGGEVRLLDMATAYSAFVNKGHRAEPVAILKVTDANGKVLEENKPQKGKQVLTPEQAYLMSSILSDNEARSAEFGTNSFLRVTGLNVMVKTGTTNDKRDNWTIGGNSNAMVGVWVGNNDNSPMLKVASGVSGASPIWHKIVVAAMSGRPNVDFEVPANIITAQVDSVSGYAAHDGFPSRSESFAKGTEPTGPDPVHTNLKVCKNDGNLANPSDVSGGNYDTKEYFVFKEEDPTAPSGGPNKWQEGILNWLNTQADAKYHPPTGYCGSGNPLDVQFTSPTDRTSNVSSSTDVNFNAQSNSAITQASLKVNGNTSCNFSNGQNSYTCHVSFPGNGVYTLEAAASDAGGHSSNRIITIGVGTNWDAATPSPSP
jgi:1A family penicillin-binding protein